MLNIETHAQPKTESYVIYHCPDRELAIEEVTIKSNGSTERTIAGGTVLAVSSVDSKYIEPTIGGSNGLGTGAAILPVDVTVPATGDVKAVVFRRHAIAIAASVIYPSGASAAEKAALRADLEARALLVR